MGANVDAGSATVGSSLDPWGVIHADGPVHVPCGGMSSLIREVNAEDLRTAARSRSARMMNRRNPFAGSHPTRRPMSLLLPSTS